MDNHDNKITRPWGYYRSLQIGENFQVKEIVVFSGQRLSLQSHQQRAEHWVVVQGPALITINDQAREYPTGSHAFIPLKAKHRLANSGEREVRIIETQIGAYLGEDDITRYEDDYQRTVDR